MSRPVKIILVLVIFLVLYIPVGWLWGKALPAYSRFLASVSQTVTNAFESADTSYRITVDRGDFVVAARITVGGAYGRDQMFELPGNRPTDTVSYNLSLWAALFLATVVFIKPPARWRFLLIAPLLIVLWHICDLFIFAKNTRWILVKDLQQDYARYVSYSYNWHWFWMWALEFNRRIVDPFLPLALWFLFCFRSFFTLPAERPST
ncbi:MAG TPA: hypothetical protein VMY05_02015 [Acidobacteriota bacterium]|nr:hypothetical protein [Acidobacteriota bacterium]